MSGIDYRALCAELLDEVAARPLILDRELINRARAALAQPEPEAVGPSDEEIMGLMSQQMHDDLAAAVRALAEQEGFDSTPAKGVMRIMLNRHVVDLARAALARYGHQPAPPAAGEPSDENCWQWYTYCPEEGLEMYSDRKQAQSAAQSIMGSYEVAAHSDGWHEDMESVSWGMLVPVEQAQVVERKTADPDSEFDEWVKYELRPARYGHQPAPHVEGEVAELTRWLRMQGEAQKPGPNSLLSDRTKKEHHAAGVKLTRAADLLERQAAPVLEPALARINDILNDSGRILQTDELEALELARRALEQRHPAPVPVSERLPAMVTDGLRVAGDCDEQGRCWAGTRASVDTSGDRDIDLPPSWELREVCAQDDVWLPHYALPLPSGEVE